MKKLSGLIRLGKYCGLLFYDGLDYDGFKFKFIKIMIVISAEMNLFMSTEEWGKTEHLKKKKKYSSSN